MYVNVKGGPDGGWKRLGAAHSPWSCVCKAGKQRRVNPGYRASCVDCKQKRPT